MISRELYFIHHSSYLYIEDRVMLLFDYFGEPSIAQLLSNHNDKHLFVLISHSHSDHYNPVIHSLCDHHEGGVSYIFHEEVRHAVPRKKEERITFIKTGDEYKCGSLYVKSYGSTDIGGSFYIETGSFRLFHAGDLNNWHWNEEASPPYIQQYEQEWQRELSKITIDSLSLDLLMFPTDLRLGKDYLKGLEEFLAQVPCKYLAPMHINGILKETRPLEVICEKYDIELLMPLPMQRRPL